MNLEIDELLRRWKASGSDVDEANYLRTRMKIGELPEHRIAMAAALGNPGARMCVDKYPQLPDHHRSKIMAIISVLEPAEKVLFAVECAERVYRYWAEAVPADGCVDRAIKTCRDFAKGLVPPPQQVQEIARMASDAARAFDDPNKERFKNPRLVAAVYAADAAVQATRTVEGIVSINLGLSLFLPDDVEKSCSYAARFAVIAKAEYAGNDRRVESEEEQWQTARLVDYVLKRAP